MRKSSKKPDLSFELAFLEGIYKRDKDDPRTVEVLASFYTESGQYKKGLELDLRHVTLEPDNPSAHYNCACSLCLTKDFDGAFEELNVALHLGFDSLDWMRKDPDLAGLRKDPRWNALLAEHEMLRNDK